MKRPDQGKVWPFQVTPEQVSIYQDADLSDALVNPHDIKATSFFNLYETTQEGFNPDGQVDCSE